MYVYIHIGFSTNQFWYSIDMALIETVTLKAVCKGNCDGKSKHYRKHNYKHNYIHKIAIYDYNYDYDYKNYNQPIDVEI
jgi:hypothetical protein